jgi:hypothetical protein
MVGRMKRRLFLGVISGVTAHPKENSMEQEPDPQESPFVVPEDDVPEDAEGEEVEGEHSPPPELIEESDDA